MLIMSLKLDIHDKNENEPKRDKMLFLSLKISFLRYEKFETRVDDVPGIRVDG